MCKFACQQHIGSESCQFELTKYLLKGVNLGRLIAQTAPQKRKVSHEPNACSSNTKQTGQGIYWWRGGLQRLHHTDCVYRHDCEPHCLNP